MTTFTLLPDTPPPPAAPDVTTGPANPFLDWLHLADSDGGQIAHYRLLLEPRFYDMLHRIFWAGGADLLYLGYLLGSAVAAAIMRLVLDPNQWLTPVTSLYNGITSRVYSVIPPTAIMTATFALLVLSVFGIRNGTKTSALPHQARGTAPAPGLLEQWLPSNAQISKAEWQRLGSGLVMMGIVVVLAANPFKIIQEIVNAVLALAEALSFTGAHGGTAHYVTTTTTDFMRTVSFLVNYRQALDPACARMWSMSINAGGANPRCLTPSQAAGADPDTWTLALAAASLFIAWAFLSFSIIVAMEFFKHLSLTVGNAVAATWIAAATLSRRRPYDALAECAARAGVHGLLALVVLFISATGPALFLQLVTSVLSFTPVLIQVLLAAGGYYISGKIILFFMEKKTSLFGLFRDKIKASKTWVNLYPPAAPATATSTMLEGSWNKPATWAKQRSTTAWNKLKTTAESWVLQDQGGQAVPVDIIEDSAESLAATERIKLRDKPTETVIVSGDDDTIGNGRDSAANTEEPTQASPVIAASMGQGTIVAASPLGDTSPPAHGDHQLPTVWFRGGLPQFAPPPPQFNPPATLFPPVPPPPPPPGAPQMTTNDSLAAHRSHLYDAMRADAALLHRGPNPTPPPQSTEDILARTTETYRGYLPASSTAPPPPRPQRKAPELRSVLAAAQWIQKFNHNVNVLRARGIDAIPVLSDAEESMARIVFATDSAGRNSIEPKNDRGFGDRI